MSAALVTAGLSTSLSPDVILPLRPISASHDANHRANGATNPAGKRRPLMFGTIPAWDPSTAFSDQPSEDPFSDSQEVPVDMSDTGGFPLQRYPNVVEDDLYIYGTENWISRVSQQPAHDHGPYLRSCGLFPNRPCVFDAEDERKMVSAYVDAVDNEEVWDRTRYCGLTEKARKNPVVPMLHEALLGNMFAAGVNDAYTAMGGPPYYGVWGIRLVPDWRELPRMGVRVAEVGDLRMLRNMQHFRALPYYNHEWLLEPTQADPPMEEMGEATEFGDPEAEEGHGAYDETETF